MPINYISLQLQIKDYCKQAKSTNKSRALKIDRALDLLHRCTEKITSGALQNIPALSSPHYRKESFARHVGTVAAKRRSAASGLGSTDAYFGAFPPIRCRFL